LGCFVEPDDDEDDEDDEDDDEEEEEEDDEDEEELSDSLPLRKGRRFRVSEANIASLREQILPNGERAGATCQSPNRTTKTRMKMMMTTKTTPIATRSIRMNALGKIRGRAKRGRRI
jgi:hypothetical protein